MGLVGLVAGALDVLLAGLARQLLGHAADLAVADAARLTDPQRTRSLASWFDRANRTRDLLRTTVRADLAVVDLLRAWRADGGRVETGGMAAGGRRR